VGYVSWGLLVVVTALVGAALVAGLVRLVRGRK
jgi:hypothetical protein